MAPRANWKGYLRLSLVSCSIALYPASSLSEKVTTTAADPNVTLQLQKKDHFAGCGASCTRDRMANPGTQCRH